MISDEEEERKHPPARIKENENYFLKQKEKEAKIVLIYNLVERLKNIKSEVKNDIDDIEKIILKKQNIAKFIFNNNQKFKLLCAREFILKVKQILADKEFINMRANIRLKRFSFFCLKKFYRIQTLRRKCLSNLLNSYTKLIFYSIKTNYKLSKKKKKFLLQTFFHKVFHYLKLKKKLTKTLPPLNIKNYFIILKQCYIIPKKLKLLKRRLFLFLLFRNIKVLKKETAHKKTIEHCSSKFYYAWFLLSAKEKNKKKIFFSKTAKFYYKLFTREINRKKINKQKKEYIRGKVKYFKKKYYKREFLNKFLEFLRVCFFKSMRREASEAEEMCREIEKNEKRLSGLQKENILIKEKYTSNVLKLKTTTNEKETYEEENKFYSEKCRNDEANFKELYKQNLEDIESIYYHYIFRFKQSSRI